MPGCLLVIIGEKLDIDRALEGCKLTPCRLWRSGEKRSRISAKLNENSGLKFRVSEQDGRHVPLQVKDAVDFLGAHESEVRKLVSANGVEHALLDFGWEFPYERSPLQWNSFPIDLLKLCSELSLSICVSVYACSKDGEGDIEGEQQSRRNPTDDPVELFTRDDIMTAQTCRDLLTGRPFKPFRIVMSNGESCEVLHPEVAFVTKTDLLVGVDVEDDGVPARFKICSLLHVTAVEPLEAASK